MLNLTRHGKARRRQEGGQRVMTHFGRFFLGRSGGHFFNTQTENFLFFGLNET